MHAAPPGLAHFQKATGGALGPSRSLLSKRTPFAAHLPFSRRRAEVERAFDEGRMPQAHMLLGLRTGASSGFGPPLFCSTCAKEDQATYGYSRWLLQHQLPANWICTIHLTPLQRATGPLAWALPQNIESSSLQLSSANADQALRLALLSSELPSLSCVNTDALRAVLLAEMARRGICPNPGRLNADALQAAFVASATAKLLSATSPDRPWWVSSSWIHHTLRGSSVAQPLKWLILWNWLHDDLSGAESAHHFQLTSRDGRSHSYPDQFELWEQSPAVGVDCLSRVQQAMSQSTTLEEVQRVLGIGYHVLRKWFAEHPQLSLHWHARKIQIRRELALSVIETFVLANPAAHKHDLVEACTSDFRWLQRNDQAALNETLSRLPAKRSVQRNLELAQRDTPL